MRLTDLNFFNSVGRNLDLDTDDLTTMIETDTDLGHLTENYLSWEF